MTGTLLNLIEVLPSEDVHGDGRPPRSMGGDELPLRHVDGLYYSVGIPLFYADRIIQADVTHELVQVVVVIADCCRVGCLVAVFLQEPENTPVEASGIDSHHVRMALKQVTAQDEHVTNLVHRLSEIRPPVGIKAVDVKIGNARHFVSSQGNLLASRPPDVDVGVAGRHGGIVLDRPAED